MPLSNLTNRRLALAFLIVALPFVAVTSYLHLRAPVALAGDGVTWKHGIAAVAANLTGPWAALVVRTVDFPNAGLRGFSLPVALVLTAILIAFFPIAFSTRRAVSRWLWVLGFVPLAAAWFFTGLFGIADGLL